MTSPDATREAAANAIRTFCQSLGAGTVAMTSDGVERIYYAGLSIDALSVAVALALSATTDRDGWQPIETAPRDGSHVIVAVTNDPPGFPGYVAEAYFDEDEKRWYSANTHSTDYHDGSLYPSHWQPLPSAPSLKSPQQQEGPKP